MALRPPIIGQLSVIGFLPILLAYIAAMAVAQFLGFDPVIGILAVFALLIALRNLVPIKHRKGIRLMKQNQFASAIPLFQESYEFFARRSWLDRYRSIFILSASKMSYREMALVNIGFAYSQIGDGAKAIEWYERTLKEFPKSSLANAALKMLNSTRKDQSDV